LHQHLLDQGAACATGIDLAEKMIGQARELAQARGLADRTDYRVGDFIEIADRIEDADVTILDKVLCCYPDAEALVKKSLAKTRRVYAYTLPRNRWWMRVGAKIMAAVLWCFGSPFRSYVHDPKLIEAQVTAEGFEKRYENQTAVWLTQVFVRR
jgi:magnesium-protoporphyrin O-methyltransferase